MRYKRKKIYFAAAAVKKKTNSAAASFFEFTAIIRLAELLIPIFMQIKITHLKNDAIK